jgi:beta-lactamase regulating signal transducer with metallopeptidase domain
MITPFLNESQAMSWIWTLADFALKGAIVLSAAGLVNWLGRRAAAATRHQIWVLALGGLLMAPVLGLILPARGVSFIPSYASQPAISQTPATAPEQMPEQTMETPLTEAPVLAAKSEELTPIAAPVAQPVAAPRAAWYSFDRLHWPQIVLLVWLLGALFVLGRMALATLAVRACALNSEYVIDYQWTATAKNLEARLDLTGHVALLKSPYVSTPMTCGVVNPIVLLPLECDDWSEEWRRIVLLHELAHIKRRDCLTQMMAQLACAIYWFNPLVWFAAKQMRAEREMACDDQVLEVGTRPSDYAGHLVEIAKSLGASNPLAAASVGMACSQLESRVRAILDPHAKRRGVNRLKAFGLSLGAICLIAPLSMARPQESKASIHEGASDGGWLKDMVGAYIPLKVKAGFAADAIGISAQQTPSPRPSPNPQSQPAPSPVPASVPTSVPTSVENADTTDDEDDSDEQEVDVSVNVNVDVKVAQGQAASQRGANSAELTPDQIIQMKQFNITAEFIEAMKKQGFENLNLRQLVQLRTHDITQEFIDQARGWNGGQATIREIVQLKIAGMTPEYIASMKASGYDKLTIKELSEMKLHGVSPEYIASIKRQGYDTLTSKQITSLKIHGITEDYIKSAQAWLGAKPPINELMALKIHELTPEYAAKMKALGFETQPIKKLMELKVHGVNEEYVKEMRGLGFENLTPEQIVKMKIFGVDAEYVKKLRASGFKNVSATQMLDMKIRGIDSILLKEGR